MPRKYDVPAGWKKGEELNVSKKKVGDSLVWFIERPMRFSYEGDVEADDIASIWFYSLEEFTGFMRWWFWA